MWRSQVTPLLMVSSGKSKVYKTTVAICVAAAVFFSVMSFMRYYYTQSGNAEGNAYKTIKVLLGNDTYTLDISDNSELRQLGLGLRTSLPVSRGMIFVFDKPAKYPFWMKDMQFSIDIAWLDASNTIVGLAENVSPSTYPKSLGPKAPALYVIELNAGTFSKEKIKMGDRVIFNQNNLKASSK